MNEHDKILPAIAKAMGSVKAIGRSGENKHDNYKFASIDDFLAAVGPICSDNGLIFLMQETGIEDFTRKGKYGDSAWMRVMFAITVYHASGQTLPPVSRSVEVLRNGAQAYGSAQSYALKQFQRSLLLIPTGDNEDADFSEKGEGVIVSNTPPPAKADARPIYKTLQNDMRQYKSADDLLRWWKDPDVMDLKNQLPSDWLKNLKDEFVELGKSLREHDAAPTDEPKFT